MHFHRSMRSSWIWLDLGCSLRWLPCPGDELLGGWYGWTGMQVWAEPGWYMLVTLLWAPALDTHGTVRCTSAPAMVGMVGVGYDLAVTLVSRYGGAGGYLRYANCP